MKEISEQTKKRRIAYWLLIGCLMIIVQIIIGGVTRLTGSGLSITEWKPLLGAIPPLNEQEWLVAFKNYQQIAQYKLLNASFTLSDFKFIFFWEWFHRLWARSLGVVFAIPFIYFLVKKYFTKDMILPLILLFILGGLQGLIGWIMVKSGLNDTDIYVSHIRLAIHFVAALVLLVYTFWFALKLLIPEKEVKPLPSIRPLLVLCSILLVLQLFYGGFMAGLRGAIHAPTWPSINGGYFPETLGTSSLMDEPLNVHFIHRNLAYILAILVLLLFFRIRKEAKKNQLTILLKTASLPLVFILIQITLGILTVLSAPKITPGHFGQFESFAELHQIVALFLLLSLVLHYYLTKRSA